MNTKDYTMSKNEYIALIIEHCVNQGYKSADRFVDYITKELMTMDEKELHAELEMIESRT